MNELDNNLPNVNQHNPYNGWDRGLFLVDHEGESCLGKIDKMTYITYGGLSAPGILTYTVRIYRLQGVTEQLLRDTPYITLGPYKTIMRLGLQCVIIPESMAIHAFKNGKLDVTPDQVSEVVTQGTRLVLSATKGSVRSIQTTLAFYMDDLLLVKGEASIEFKIINTKGTTRVVRFDKSGDIDPVTDTLMYIKKKLDEPD